MNKAIHLDQTYCSLSYCVLKR